MTIDYKISKASEVVMENYPHIILIDSLIYGDTRKYLRSISCINLTDYIIIDQEPDAVEVYDRPLAQLFCFKEDRFVVLLTLWLPVIPPNEIDMNATMENLFAAELRREIDNQILEKLRKIPLKF